MSHAVVFYIYKLTYEGFDKYNAIYYALIYSPIYFHHRSH
jgi:hypothetical protein